MTIFNKKAPPETFIRNRHTFVGVKMSDVIVIPGLIRNPVKLPESRPANSGIRLAGIAPKDREKLKAVIGNVLTEIAIPPGLK